MIDREWLVQEIAHLQALEGPAAIRFGEAELTYKRVKYALNTARDELESLKVCREELERELAAMDEKGL